MNRVVLLLVSLLLAPPAAASTCPAPTSKSELVALMDRAERAYGAMDADAFEAAVDETALVLGCLATPLDAWSAAQLHRIRALRAFADGDIAGVRASFTAARRLAPHYAFPSAWIPEGHPLADAWSAVVLAEPEATAVPQPAVGEIAFDGRRGPSRPTDRATVVQLLDPHDVPTVTDYLYPHDPLPTYAAASAPVRLPPPEARPDRRGVHAPLLVVSGAAAAASVAMYGAAVAAEARFKDPSHAPDADHADLIRMRRSTNTLFYTSVGLGAAAVTGGAAAVLVGRF